MVSWSTVQSLVIFFGPIVLPRLLAFYRSLKAPSHITPQPLSSSARLSLNILFFSALLFLASTLPYFSPRNIFAETSSRLQTPTGVLFTRLTSLRPLSPSESLLRDVFEKGGLEARLLYLRFGPHVTSTCPLIEDAGKPDSATLYFLYALPSILAPHLLHLFILGLVTSAAFTGLDAGRWRTAATIAGLLLAGIEVAAFGTYDHSRNAGAKTSAEMDFWFWKVRMIRGIVVAGADALLGWVIYLSATKRAFVVPKPAAERAEESAKAMEGVLGKLRGLGAVRNVVFRNNALRGKLERYWIDEEGMVRSVLEDQEVVSALSGVLGSVDTDKLSREAETYADSVLGGWQVQQDNG